LDSDRDLFQAELALSQIRLNELNSVVQLYKALGGGWQSSIQPAEPNLKTRGLRENSDRTCVK